MDKAKVTFLSEMVANFLSETIENEIKTVENTTLESVVEFIKNSDESTFKTIIELLEGSDSFDRYVDKRVEEEIDNSTEYVRRDEIDVSFVDELGLSEDVANDYLENLSSYDMKEFIKNQIDNL